MTLPGGIRWPSGVLRGVVRLTSELANVAGPRSAFCECILKQFGSI